MATHYSETIMADLKAALEGITASGGYNNTLLDVVRLDRFRAVEGAPPFATIRRMSATGIHGEGSRECEVTVQAEVNLVLRQDSDSSERTDELEGEWIADVLMALGAKFFVDGKPQFSWTVAPLSEDSAERDDGLRFVITFSYGEDITTLAYTGP